LERRCDGLSDRISPTQGQTVPWRLSAPQWERTPQTLAGLSKPARALLSVEGGGRETKQRDSSTLLARYSPAKVLGQCAALDKYPMQHCWQWKGSQGTTRLACASEHLPGKCVAPWQTRDPAAASWLQPTKTDSFRDYCSEAYAFGGAQLGCFDGSLSTDSKATRSSSPGFVLGEPTVVLSQQTMQVV
jgi:hypothetical protein